MADDDGDEPATPAGPKKAPTAALGVPDQVQTQAEVHTPLGTAPDTRLTGEETGEGSRVIGTAVVEAGGAEGGEEVEVEEEAGDDDDWDEDDEEGDSSEDDDDLDIQELVEQVRQQDKRRKKVI